MHKISLSVGNGQATTNRKTADKGGHIMKNERGLTGIFVCLVLLLFTAIVWAAPVQETGQDNVTGLIWENTTDDGSFDSAGIEIVDEALTITGSLSVSPASRSVAQDAGTTTFRVSNIGTGTMPWTAAVISEGNWLFIASGTRGTDAGTITCSFTANTSTSVSRTATIRVTAAGAAGSPVDVTVKQSPKTCSATLDGNLLLHIPYLSSVNQMLGTILFWADFAFEFNPTKPTLIPFKLTNYDIINNPSSCEPSELSIDLKISIPDLLLADGNTHLWVDMEYSPDFSTNGNIFFVVTNFGVVSN